jgi:hypothetical protein
MVSKHIDHIADIIGQDFINNVDDLMTHMATIMYQRQADYGAGNINNAYGGALNGVVVRMGDKYERIKNLLTINADPQGERITDSFIDLANYCVIALMLLNNTWPTNGGQPCEKDTTNVIPRNVAELTQ